MTASHSVDRDGLREILGYGGLATRIVNLLGTADMGTPSHLRKATYSDLLDIPGFGNESLGHVIASLKYHDAVTARSKHEEGP